MFNGLTIEKLLLIGLIAALIIGPDRLPRYAEGLASFTRRAREWSRGARDRVKEEMGEDFQDVEWRKLDPRQYDPRRIIRDALLDDDPATPVATATAATTPTRPPRAPRTTPLARKSFTSEEPPPFDAEST